MGHQSENYRSHSTRTDCLCEIHDNNHIYHSGKRTYQDQQILVLSVKRNADARRSGSVVVVQHKAYERKETWASTVCRSKNYRRVGGRKQSISRDETHSRRNWSRRNNIASDRQGKEDYRPQSHRVLKGARGYGSALSPSLALCFSGSVLLEVRLRITNNLQ